MGFDLINPDGWSFEDVHEVDIGRFIAEEIKPEEFLRDDEWERMQNALRTDLLDVLKNMAK